MKCGMKITVRGNYRRLSGIANQSGAIGVGEGAPHPEADMTRGGTTIERRALPLPAHRCRETVEIDGRRLIKFLEDLAGNENGEL
jgi:formylmethanofuran dehydrogenase subunit C